MTATDPVQAVAQAIHEHDANASMSGAPWPTWDELSDDGRAAYGYVAEAAVAAARPLIAAEALREAKVVRVSVLEGHLRAVHKVLFEDAATSHDQRLRRASAVLDQADALQPEFDNAFAAIRAERDALAAKVAAVEALADEWEQRCEHYRGTGNYHAQRAVTNELRAALATGTEGQACVHCGRRFTGSAHDEGDHRGKQRCDPDDTGQPYGLNAHAPGTPCQSPCAGTRANQEADQGG